ncbi:MAG: pyridoxamine 5'-phosphate oxidase family protein [Streptosporangiales bacterium]|nr:pyridoxamine 5'-phosphate oxidase family protein [Streptosporangiales bacterium]
MYETAEELDRLQDLLDTSLEASTAHLRAIVKPGERTLPADRLTEVLTGMCTLSIATVTARREPRISGIDGHFVHGTWIFGTDASAAKARHLRARPAVSVAHLRGEALGVFAHGTAELIYGPEEREHPLWPEAHRHLLAHYNDDPVKWGDIVYYRLQPSWMVAYAFAPDSIPET